MENNTIQNKIPMNEIKEKINADSYSRKGDVITVRVGYFYTFGRSVTNLINEVLKAYPNAKIIASGDHYANFRGGDTVAQGSHWFVKFTI